MSNFAVPPRKRKAPGVNNLPSSSSATRHNSLPLGESKSFDRDSGKWRKGKMAGESKGLKLGRETKWAASNLKARKQRKKGGKGHLHKAKSRLREKARSDFGTPGNSKTERRAAATKRETAQSRRRKNSSAPLIRVQQEIDSKSLENLDEYLPAQQVQYNLVTPIIPVMVPMEIRMVLLVICTPVMILPDTFSSAANEHSIDSKDDMETKTYS
eukprot:TRINITY_DN2183_c0_g10_i1.p2 TRINITY_DN2183_c0_g10~~TRINITY_DN2183_c0_g10_i1.p2  ORF type:complete len:213 (+),score=11.19 TRINITY_DN2183_c0_g10_i1:33-671(+)